MRRSEFEEDVKNSSYNATGVTGWFEPDVRVGTLLLVESETVIVVGRVFASSYALTCTCALPAGLSPLTPRLFNLSCLLGSIRWKVEPVATFVFFKSGSALGDTEIWWSEILRTSPQPLLEPCKTPSGPSGSHIAHMLFVRLRLPQLMNTFCCAAPVSLPYLNYLHLALHHSHLLTALGRNQKDERDRLVALNAILPLLKIISWCHPFNDYHEPKKHFPNNNTQKCRQSQCRHSFDVF